MNGGGSRVVARPVTPALLGDWLAFFDGEAFADNPEWFGCYCQWFHQDAGSWESRTAEDNRASSIDMIGSGRLRGYLAYAEDRVAGWCQAAPRLSIPNIASDPALALEDADQVGSIVCFVVGAAFRRQGVATTLLAAACAGFREQGLRFAEAYPVREATGDATNYHGPLSLYLRAGFEPFREVGSIVIVRCKLTR